jgi:lysophospholipase L1-like esterase
VRIVLLSCWAFWAASAGAGEWLTTWAAAPTALAAGDPVRELPSFDNRTVRQQLRISVGGIRLRIRFTNEFGSGPLRIGGARIGRGAFGGHGAESRVVTFSGKTSTIIPAGAPLVSDPIDLTVPALSSLTISLYLQEATSCSCHAPSLQTAYVSAGDSTSAVEATGTAMQLRAFVSGIDVETRARRARSIVVLGDSISDGVGSTADANRRWTDVLAERLIAGNRQLGVANAAISGNRLLSDGAGQSALARFDRDVLSLSAVTHLVVFIGINDLGSQQGSEVPGTESLISGYRQIIARAHLHGIKVIGATLTPFGGARIYSVGGEVTRQAVNEWIRHSREFDGVLDFDAVLRDPARPAQMASDLESGDHLHGNDAAYAKMARAVNLTLFQ